MNAPAPPRFSKTFTAEPRHIDELGHVNNSVWVQWIQDIATAHWDAVADPGHRARYIWVVVRHEIDYRGNIGAGETALGETHIDGKARGATSVRVAIFTDAAGKRMVSARTTWAMLERGSGRPARIRDEVLAPFRES
ncbi:acyl-CoA thioesterase [Erythrobacter sp.]|jgi:acyl-CoA thioester hydrolase|uniref:acyl-CoA thioesterase n=1 Tax=Erythrobacter sp. TaxID=1042 RepID=UPI002EC27882|nr:acyl-CoA thioesterase [Erythrobacter sp.]